MLHELEDKIHLVHEVHDADEKIAGEIDGTASPGKELSAIQIKQLIIVFELIGNIEQRLGTNEYGKKVRIFKKEDLWKAQGGCLGLYDKIDVDAVGHVSREIWLEFFHKVYRMKGIKLGVDKAEAWLRMYLSKITRNMGVDDLISKVTASHAGYCGMSPAQNAECKVTFEMLAHLGMADDRFKKEDLIIAQGADFGIFEEIDVDEVGYVTVKPWMDWLRAKHEEFGNEIVHLAHAWLRHTLHTMHRNVANHAPILSEDRAAAFSAMSPEDRAAAFSDMSPEERAAAFSDMSEEARTAMFAAMSPAEQAATLSIMSAAQQAAVFAAMSPRQQAATLAAMSTEERAKLKMKPNLDT